MGFATIAQFRDTTGLQINELSDTEVQQYLDGGDRQIKKDAFVYVREEEIGQNSDTGYYFPRLRYFADQNADGSITATDIQVREYLPTYDTTSAVDSSNITAIDEYNCYFTLNNSSYTTSNQIRVSYWFAKKPNSEIIEELQEMAICWAAHEAFRFIKTKRLKGGIVSFSLGKLNVTRTEADYELMVDQWRKRYQHLSEFVRPSRFRRVAEGRFDLRRGRHIYHSYGGQTHVSTWGIVGNVGGRR